MLIYQRYIAKSILTPLLVIAFIITSLVWITQILKLLYLIDKGIRLGHFLGLVILVVPSLLFMVLPFITILAVIYTYNRLGEERQLIIFKNAGLANLSLAVPAILVAALVTIFAYYLSLSAMPASYSKLKSELSFLKDNYTSSIIKEKTFSQISKNFTVYVNKKSPDGYLYGLVLFDNRADKPVIVFARSGQFLADQNSLAFELKEGNRQEYDSNGNLTRLYFDSLIVELNSNQQSEHKQDKDNRDVSAYYLNELLHPNSGLPLQRQLKLLTEGHQRLVWPAYNFVLTFLALAVFLKQPYNKKSHIRQILLTTAAIVFATYAHFSFHNIATKNIYFIYAYYINILAILSFSIWLYKRKTI